MNRFVLAAAASLTLLGGCIGSAVTNGGSGDGGKKGGNGDGSSGGNDGVDMSIDLRGEFNSKVLPLLTQDCGSCHANGNAGTFYPTFLLAGSKPTVYDNFTAWPYLVGTTPATSEILTKGAHETPVTYATANSQFASHIPAISQWIVDYNAAGGSNSNVDGGSGVALTAPQALTMGSLNTVKLDSLGAAFKGTTITFTPSMVGSTELQLLNVTLNATATAGLTVTGTVVSFYTPPDVMNTVAIDTDFNTDSFTAYEGGTALLGTTITPYAAGQYLAFSFTSVAPAMGMPDMGSTTTMCKDLTDFASFKQDLLGMNGITPNCTGCHVGGSGSGAFNMAGFSSTTNDAASCVTMLSYVNVTTPNMSDVYMRISGGATHPATLSAANQTTFLSALTKWLNGEK